MVTLKHELMHHIVLIFHESWKSILVKVEKGGSRIVEGCLGAEHSNETVKERRMELVVIDHHHRRFAEGVSGGVGDSLFH